MTNSYSNDSKKIKQADANTLARQHVFESKADNYNRLFSSRGSDLDKISIYAKVPVTVQTKLMVNAPGDKYEQEANAVADEIIRKPVTNSIQRKCAECKEENDEKHLQRKASSENISPLPQSKRESGVAARSSLSSQITSTTGKGHGMDTNTRSFMSNRFGFDFSKVRVHTDDEAARLNRELNARAFTIGNDIYFNSGEYNTTTETGQRLLAHELTHTIQQSTTQSSPNGMGIHSGAFSDGAAIQRYEGPEHQDLGDRNLEELFQFVQTPEGKKWAQDKGIDPIKLVNDMNNDPVYKKKKIKVRDDLELTPGDIIALMGDFYATWEEFKSAPKKEIDDILKIMKQERSGLLDNPNAEYEKATKGRFTKLARINTKHFAPVNKDAWKKMHVQAITKANDAGKKNDEDAFQEALFIDAAASHFLTDSFASGHLFDSSKVLVAIMTHLRNNPPQSENPEMQTVIGATQIGGVTPQLVLKNIHDRMNREGFFITNNKKMSWKSYGDNHLKNAVETQRIASYAVFVSRQQIIEAKQGKQPDPNEVLDLLPNEKTIEQATDQAYAYIPDAVRDLTPLIHRNAGMLDTLKVPLYLGGPILPFVGKSILETISDPARPKVIEDYNRRKAIDPSTPYPTPPLLKWEF